MGGSSLRMIWIVAFNGCVVNANLDLNKQNSEASLVSSKDGAYRGMITSRTSASLFNGTLKPGVRIKSRLI